MSGYSANTYRYDQYFTTPTTLAITLPASSTMATPQVNGMQCIWNSCDNTNFYYLNINQSNVLLTKGWLGEQATNSYTLPSAASLPSDWQSGWLPTNIMTLNVNAYWANRTLTELLHGGLIDGNRPSSYADGTAIRNVSVSYSNAPG